MTCRATHPARVRDAELLDEGQRAQALAQVGLVGGCSNGCHARQAVDGAGACDALPCVRLHARISLSAVLCREGLSGLHRVQSGDRIYLHSHTWVI